MPNNCGILVVSLKKMGNCVGILVGIVVFLWYCYIVGILPRMMIIPLIVKVLSTSQVFGLGISEPSTVCWLFHRGNLDSHQKMGIPTVS